MKAGCDLSGRVAFVEQDGKGELLCKELQPDLLSTTEYKMEMQMNLVSVVSLEAKCPPRSTSMMCTRIWFLGSLSIYSFSCP